MKNIAASLIICLLLFHGHQLGAQSLQWAGQLGSPGSVYTQAIALDADGNTYTTGWFSGTADFDPGTATANLTVGVGGNTDIFVSKLDALGQFVWVKQLGGNGYDYARAIALDQAGNIHIAGDFQGTADFDPGPNTFPITSNAGGQNDVFVCKLDPSGNFIWAKRMGGTGSERGFGIAVNSAQEVYTTGNFSGTADFDPGTAEATLTGAGPDIYVSKLDAFGNFVWVKQMGGPGDDAALAITLAQGGDVLLTGYFRGAADFDPGPETQVLNAAGGLGESDAFVCRLSAEGSLVWAGGMGGEARDIGYAIAAGPSGQVCFTGSFTGVADFDPGPATVELVSASDFDRSIFVAQLNGAGNFQWAGQLGGPNAGDGLGIAVDADGGVYSTGFFNGPVDFDPGAAELILTAEGIADAFISKLHSDGTVDWAARLGGAGQLGGSAIAVLPNGTVHATGFFFGTADLDPGPNSFNLTAPPNTANSYVLRLVDPTTGLSYTTGPHDMLRIYPNPSAGPITVSATGTLDELVVHDALGRTVHRSRPGSNAHTLQLPAPGAYVVRVTMNGNTVERRVLVH